MVSSKFHIINIMEILIIALSINGIARGLMYELLFDHKLFDKICHRCLNFWLSVGVGLVMMFTLSAWFVVLIPLSYITYELIDRQL